jgi:hypothetical protein
MTKIIQKEATMLAKTNSVVKTYYDRPIFCVILPVLVSPEARACSLILLSLLVFCKQ